MSCLEFLAAQFFLLTIQSTIPKSVTFSSATNKALVMPLQVTRKSLVA
jgi:hypothetical protein